MTGSGRALPVNLKKARTVGLLLAGSGIALLLLVHWLVMDFVPTEAVQGVVQRIFYIHPPSGVDHVHGRRYLRSSQSGLSMAGG